ncbi:hypothetical protein DFQ27_002663 [Actinomortierella ambigua]|uniref:F-box domain-containing protein n=1 Tax=Actinomortierella ambigua TaxID=1343610 RepID=A0A9P6Q6X7_9FUNG|nr:hypothetical protein DFQ27_002663 [Actinomortierella ambigua]
MSTPFLSKREDKVSATGLSNDTPAKNDPSPPTMTTAGTRNNSDNISAPPLPPRPPTLKAFHGLPSELIQHIASFLSFEDLLRLYKSLPHVHRPVVQVMVDQVIALMVLQLEIYQARSSSSLDNDNASGGGGDGSTLSGMGGLANRMINRLLSLVVMEPSSLLTFGTDGQQDEVPPPPPVPMANPPDPDPVHGMAGGLGEDAAAGGIGARQAPVAQDATLSTSWRAVAFDKELLRITFELEEKLELERTVRQQQPSMFTTKDDAKDNDGEKKSGEVRQASRALPNKRSRGLQGHADRGEGQQLLQEEVEQQEQEISQDKSHKGKKKSKRSGLEPPHLPAATAVTLRTPPLGAAAAATTPTISTSPKGIVHSTPSQGLCQSLLDSHLRENSYFHCISTTQPAFLQSAKVVFRGSRSMAAPWFALPSTDPRSLWSRSRAHWSLADIEDALAQQQELEREDDDDDEDEEDEGKEEEDDSQAGRWCFSSGTSSDHHCHQSRHSDSHNHRNKYKRRRGYRKAEEHQQQQNQFRLSKRAQDRIATFQQNRVLARFLARQAHALGNHHHHQNQYPRQLSSGKEYLATKVPLEVSELCGSKTVEVNADAGAVDNNDAWGEESGTATTRLSKNHEHCEPADRMGWEAMDGDDSARRRRLEDGQRQTHRMRKRDALRQLLFGGVEEDEGHDEDVAISRLGSWDVDTLLLPLLGSSSAHGATKGLSSETTHQHHHHHHHHHQQEQQQQQQQQQFVVRTIPEPVMNSGSGMTRRGGRGRRNGSPTATTPATPSTTTRADVSSTTLSLVSGVAKRFIESAHYLSNLASSSSSSSSHSFQQCLMARAFQGPAGALVHPFGACTEDDDGSEDEEDGWDDIVLGTWDEGDSDRRKGKEWAREIENDEEKEEEDDDDYDDEGEEATAEQPLFELVYGVGHNYMNAARLEGERVIRPIRFSCSVDFFLSSAGVDQ